jgi:hypothetical protein
VAGGTIVFVSWLIFGLLVSAVLVLGAAEWPRIYAHFGAGREAASSPRKTLRHWRRRSHLVLIEDDETSDNLDDEREAFAESVARDLERLPTIDDRD